MGTGMEAFVGREMGGDAVATIGKGLDLLPLNLFPVCNICGAVGHLSHTFHHVSSLFILFHDVSSLIDWSNQGNMMKKVTRTCCIDIPSACPSAAPARLPIARPVELTVLSQIFSFQLDSSMSRSVTNMMSQNHPDSFGSLHCVTYMFQIRVLISLDTEYYGIPTLQIISAARLTDSSEIRTVNWSELILFSSSRSQCLPISL